MIYIVINTPYLRFLRASNKLWSDITANQREILIAALKKGPKDPYKVHDIIEMRSIASQATLHKALTKLVALGYLTLKTDPLDRRSKFVILTKKTIDLELRLAKILSQAYL